MFLDCELAHASQPWKQAVGSSREGSHTSGIYNLSIKYAPFLEHSRGAGDTSGFVNVVLNSPPLVG